MDDAATPEKLPRLSDEALALFFRQDAYSATVDLRPLLALESEFGPSVLKAANLWRVQPSSVVR